MITVASRGDNDGATLPLLAEGAAAFGFPLSSFQIQQFARYSELLLEWNQRINLTAIIDLSEIQIRHFLDSLTCAVATGNLNGKYLMDVGSGAGFPGIPLKLLYEDVNLVLVESVSKKVKFLQAVVADLDLDGVQVITERVETLGQLPAYRARFDWAVARGVASMAVLAEYLLPICRIGGKMLAQKGANAQAETRDAAGALQKLGGGRPELLQVQLPGREQLYYLVVVEKISDTPGEFPRHVGVPSKRPLKSSEHTEKRVQKAAQIILENEQLTTDLDDRAAGYLLDWALNWSELVARQTAGLDDAAAAEIMAEKLRSVRRMMRLINRWFRDRHELSYEERDALLEKVIDQATIIHGSDYHPPSSKRRTSFILNSLRVDFEAGQIVLQFRELVGGSLELPQNDMSGNSGQKN